MASRGEHPFAPHDPLIFARVHTGKGWRHIERPRID